jgi:hypothetical protein
MNGMAAGKQRLERDHGFVVLGEVAGDHQYFRSWHLFPPKTNGKSLARPPCERVLWEYYSED